MGRMWRSLLQPGQKNSGTSSMLTPSRMWWNVWFGPRQLSASSRCARAPVRCRCPSQWPSQYIALPSPLLRDCMQKGFTAALDPGPRSVTPAQLTKEQLNFPLVLGSLLVSPGQQLEEWLHFPLVLVSVWVACLTHRERPNLPPLVPRMPEVCSAPLPPEHQARLACPPCCPSQLLAGARGFQPLQHLLLLTCNIIQVQLRR